MIIFFSSKSATMALYQPHNMTEICVKFNLLPATIIVRAPPHMIKNQWEPKLSLALVWL
jgi:hypothetical protein